MMIDSPSYPVLTAAQMRAAEEAVIAAGTSVDRLMEQAGSAIAEAAWRFGGGQAAVIVCGPGNNGGDGYVAARLLKARGADVRVTALRDPRAPAAIHARAAWGGPVETLAEARPAPILIDCLFGTGLTRPLEEDVRQALGRFRQAAKLMVAADLPSGVGTDDGADLGAIAADLTIALGGLKPAHVLMPAMDLCGHVQLEDIGVGARSDVRTFAEPRAAFRPANASHKFDRAVAIVAGAMPGAAILAAEAAARVAGYTILATDKMIPSRTAALVQWPLERVLADDRIRSIVIGPGLGTDTAARLKLDAVLASDRNVVCDADALNLLAESGDYGVLRQRRGLTCLTPHAGEFSRLFGDSGGSKIDRAIAAAARTGATIIFKGRDTLVADAQGHVLIPPPGSPWLATAGTGDVLAGILGGLMSCSTRSAQTAAWAVRLHGEAARRSGPGMIADDLITHLPAAIARFQ
jgi:ADP-dependent NAD(P)H-hydrate dehydratase / NAD(P)H-hydrate epimerase